MIVKDMRLFACLFFLKNSNNKESNDGLWDDRQDREGQTLR